MRPKTLVLFALALGCGSIAAVGINQLLANRQPTVVHVTGETQPILVALGELNMGDLVTPDKVKLEAWPKDKLPPGAITNLNDIEGRRTRVKLFAGEPILDQKLLSKNVDVAGAAQFIPKGFRVVAVKVDDVSAASSLIKPGDRVDVLVHLRANPGTGINETQTVTILQDVKVFSVNDVFHRSGDGAQDAIAARTVSLLVTPPQAEVVTLATEMGTIRLVLRSMEDDTIATTGGATHLALLGQSSNADRSKEEPTSETGNALFDLLNAQKKPVTPLPATPQPPAAEVWRMILIEADKAQQIEFGDVQSLPTAVLPLSEAPRATPVAGPLPQEAAPLADHEQSTEGSLPDKTEEPATDSPETDEELPADDENVSNN